jgi:hypothetical protein
MPRPQTDGEVLVEITRWGAYAKASAIDPATGTEVSVTGPASVDDGPLRAAALRKLHFVLKRRGKGA